MAAATIEECFHFIITARKLAEAFRAPVIVLTDANLATGVQPFPRPQPRARLVCAAHRSSRPGRKVFRPTTGMKTRGCRRGRFPASRDGEYILTGLAHTNWSKVAYDPDSDQTGCDMRSRKLAALQQTLEPPEFMGDPEGDLLVVGWGSTLGAIEEAVDRARKEGNQVSSSTCASSRRSSRVSRRSFSRFKRVMTVEINYSDRPDAPPSRRENRRYAQLAWMLASPNPRRHRLLVQSAWSATQSAARSTKPSREQLDSIKEQVDNVRS